MDYYVKIPLDYPYIHHQINAGAGIRNIARDLRVKCESISNRINRRIFRREEGEMAEPLLKTLNRDGRRH
jgi:hypothetical protein